MRNSGRRFLRATGPPADGRGKRKDRNMRYVAAILIIFFSITSISIACECVLIKSAIEAMNQSKYVFQGKLIKHEKAGNLLGGETVAYVKVDRVWKGLDQSEVLIYTDLSSCEFQFQDGKSYLFYLFERDGKPYVYQCGKTDFLESAKDDIKELGQGKIPSQNVNVELKYFWVINYGVIFKTVFILFLGIMIFYFFRWRFYRQP